MVWAWDTFVLLSPLPFPSGHVLLPCSSWLQEHTAEAKAVHPRVGRISPSWWLAVPRASTREQWLLPRRSQDGGLVRSAALLQAQGSCAGLPWCVTALCLGKPEGRHLNAVSGAQFDSSALEQTKRQAGPTLLLMWAWDTGEMLGTESQILLGFNWGDTKCNSCNCTQSLCKTVSLKDCLVIAALIYFFSEVYFALTVCELSWLRL